MKEYVEFKPEQEKEYLELWDRIDPSKVVHNTAEDVKEELDKVVPLIKRLNGMKNVPYSVYKNTLAFLDIEPLIDNDVITLEFALELLPQIIATFSTKRDIGLDIIYYISERFSWHDACKFTDAAIKHIHQMYTMIMNINVNVSQVQHLKESLPKMIKDFTTYFPDEIIETTCPEYLIGYPRILYAMASGEKLNKIHKHVIVECMIIALESGLPFAKQLLETNYIGEETK